jgi:tRNA pseudouridine55 synthase
VNGFVCIDKPKGPTSFAVVKRVRHLAREGRAGHTGTLDPDATGVLVVALGKATRLLPFLPVEPKTYRFGIRFGSETDTLDASGTVVRDGGPIPAAEALHDAARRFIGEVRQEPPRYSAVKVGGERAYRLARRGQEFELSARTIHIHSLVIDSYDSGAGEAALTVVCSSGTYVRSLARDIARAAGTWGHASQVRRLQVGQFTIDRALQWDGLEAGLPAGIMPIREVFGQFAWVVLSKAQQTAAKHGTRVRLASVDSQQPVFAGDENGDLVAVLERTGPGEYHPARVFV